MIVIDVVSALFALAAGVLWWKSAVVRTPSTFSIHVVRSDGFMGQPLGGNPLGGQYIGHAHSDDLKALANALIGQSKTSGQAAMCACIAALFQATSLFAHALNR